MCTPTWWMHEQRSGGFQVLEVKGCSRGTCSDVGRKPRALNGECGSKIFLTCELFELEDISICRICGDWEHKMAELEKSKKRKRFSNGEIPKKKVAFAAPPTNSESVKVTFNDADELHPVLLSSPGLNAPRVPFKAYAKPRSTKQPTNNAPKPNTHSLLLHSSQHPRLDHTASPSTLDQDMSHYIAIFDPEKKHLQIMPAHRLSLRASLRSEVVEQDKKPRRTMYQQREELGREFGTKKAKKALDDRTTNALLGRGSADKKQSTNDVQSAILNSMSTPGGAAAMDEDQALEAALASKPIPKPNLAAENVEDVYTLNTLLPPNDAKLVPIKEWQENVAANIDMSINRIFIAKRVQAIAKRDDIPRLRALSYLNALLDFHACLTTSKTRKIPKKEILDRKLASWPAPLVTSLRHRFANAANELPKWHMQNLYTHICALALYVDGWETDTRDLREDLKLEQKEVVGYFRELGCKVSALTEKEMKERGIGSKAEAATVKMAKLKLPLDFPKVRKARR